MQTGGTRTSEVATKIAPYSSRIRVATGSSRGHTSLRCRPRFFRARLSAAKNETSRGVPECPPESVSVIVLDADARPAFVFTRSDDLPPTTLRSRVAFELLCVRASPLAQLPEVAKASTPIKSGRRSKRAPARREHLT